jgi:hypothetical protein
MELTFFVTQITGLKRPNTGKDDDDEDHNEELLKLKTIFVVKTNRIQLLTDEN